MKNTSFFILASFATNAFAQKKQLTIGHLYYADPPVAYIGCKKSKGILINILEEEEAI